LVARKKQKMEGQRDDEEKENRKIEKGDVDENEKR